MSQSQTVPTTTMAATGSFLRDLWLLCAPYFRSRDGWIGGGLLLVVILLTVGNVWVNESWKYGPHSNDCETLDFSNNWVAPADSESSPVGVSMEGARQLAR